MDEFAPVSVVVPCYRCALTIKNAVESVFAQSLIPAELILVDDCSDDATPQLLRELEYLYKGRIKVVQMQSNRGAGSARNAGWAVAIQPYIAFLDADDSWHPEKLRIQYQYMHEHPDIDLCGHQFVRSRAGEIIPVIPKSVKEKVISAYGLLFKNAFSTPTVMLKRKMLFRFQEGKRFAEDLLLWQTAAFAGLHVVRLEMPLTNLHKSPYGESGLSAELWKMEKGELANFVELHRQGHIGFFLYIIATSFSLIKYIKRLLLSPQIFFGRLRLSRNFLPKNIKQGK